LSTKLIFNLFTHIIYFSIILPLSVLLLMQYISIFLQLFFLLLYALKFSSKTFIHFFSGQLLPFCNSLSIIAIFSLRSLIFCKEEEYDEWRYKYPELDTHQIWAKVYPQELFDFIDECAKKAEKEEQKEAKRKKKK